MTLEYEGLEQQLEDACAACVYLSIHTPSGLTERPIYLKSGFVVDVSGTCYLVTAEHVYGHLIEAREADPNARFTITPYTGGINAQTEFLVDEDKWITATFIAEQFRLHFPETSLTHEIVKYDVCALRLLPYYAANLVAVGLRPFAFDQVRAVTSAEASDKIARSGTLMSRLLGVPEVTVDIKDSSCSAGFLRLPVTVDSIQGAFSMWRPEWHRSDFPYDVRGTSGGPIVLLGLDKPYVLGVQISQLRTSSSVLLTAISSSGFFEVLRLTEEAMSAPA